MKTKVILVLLSLILMGCPNTQNADNPFNDNKPTNVTPPLDDAPPFAQSSYEEIAPSSSAQSIDGKYIINIEEQRILAQAHTFSYHSGTKESKTTTISFSDAHIKLLYRDQLNYFAEYSILEPWMRGVLSLEPQKIELLTTRVSDQSGAEYELIILLINNDVVEIKIGERVFQKTRTPKEYLQNKATSSANYFEYTVKSGEVLNVLKDKFNTSVEEILRLNPQIAKRRLNAVYVGETIKIPK